MVWTRLCAAQLMSCDVIMPDEPSGHRTSHAIAFLDNLRTDIIDFQDRRLKASENAKGNTLTMFAEKYLVKKAYFELSNVTMKFAFPEPGPVVGKPTIVNVNLTLFVAVIGANWSVCISPLRAPSGRPQALILRTPSPP